MGYRYDIYIGSDNETRRLSRDYLNKTLEWASRNFPNGYTMLRAYGYFDGVREDSLVLSVVSDYNEQFDNVQELKQKLGQKAVLIAKIPIEIVVV